MKSLFKQSIAGMAVLSLVAACSPDDHTLSAPALSPEDLVEGIAFSITHDSSNPNIVHLTSLLPDLSLIHI